MKAEALWMRLREEKWQDFEVAEGKAARLEKLLQDLASRKRVRSMRACHEVWKLLCKNKVHSAAVVAVPYLVEILAISAEEVRMEVADILKSCALGAVKEEASWVEDLKRELLDSKEQLLRYQKRARGDAAIAFDCCVDAISDL